MAEICDQVPLHSGATLPQVRFTNVEKLEKDLKGLHHFETFIRHCYLWVLARCEKTV